MTRPGQAPGYVRLPSEVATDCRPGGSPPGRRAAKDWTDKTGKRIWWAAICFLIAVYVIWGNIR